MICRPSQRWWASAAVWVTIAIFTLGQAGSRQEGALAAPTWPFGNVFVEVCDFFDRGVVSVPVHWSESAWAVSLAANERPLKRLKMAAYWSLFYSPPRGSRHLVLAVMLTPQRGLDNAESDALERFKLGKRDFPNDFGAVLLPIANTHSQQVTEQISVDRTTNMYAMYVDPVVALPAEGAPTRQNMKEFERDWTTYMGVKPKRWWTPRWLWLLSAEKPQVPDPVSGGDNMAGASPLQEPMLFSGSQNLIGDDANFYASFLLWMPGAEEFVWTNSVRFSASEFGGVNFKVKPIVQNSHSGGQTSAAAQAA